MDSNYKPEKKDRKWFLSFLLGEEKYSSKQGMVKMLTADGKLVEVDKSVVEAASKKQKSSNKEIYDWMENPSKENNS
ncbi:MAG: hypothetical protein ABI666_12555 [Ferruginibacter sp.]